MARLRQYFANRYSSAESTNSEFDNIVRYVNAAEIGNLTLAELMKKIFNSDGEVDLDLEMRYNSETGLEFRMAGPDNTDPSWELVADPEELRGAPGANIGDIDSPLIYNRVDIIATAAQTVFPYVFSGDPTSILVYRNGLLLAQLAYAYSVAGNTVTLVTPATLGDTYTIYSIRNVNASSYVRTDFTAAAGQSVYPFAHEDGDQIIAYRNGILQREGVGFDYLKSATTDTVTFLTPHTAGTIVSLIIVETSAIRKVVGLMLEEGYCTNGLIRWDKLLVADNQIPQAKVASLATTLAQKPRVYVQGGTPVGMTAGDLWIFTGGSLPQLLFYDGARWINATVDGQIPLPTPTDALKFIRLNSVGTGFEYSDVDLSGAIAVAARGAANGVASLDASGRVPQAQIAERLRLGGITGTVAGSITNGTYNIGVLYGELVRIDALGVSLSAGTASVQLLVNGVPVGSAIPASVTPAGATVGPIAVDALTTPRLVQLVVSAASGASNLSYGVRRVFFDS
jgi:hypothetical protein